MDLKNYNMILITNNIKVYHKYLERLEVIYIEGSSYMEVLSYTRDKIHQGHELLTHPLSGSIKPNETPFKSIIISKKKYDLDYKSLNIIEESMITAKKFINNNTLPNWSENVLEDFRIIDLSLIENILDRLINYGKDSL